MNEEVVGNCIIRVCMVDKSDRAVDRREGKYDIKEKEEVEDGVQLMGRDGGEWCENGRERGDEDEEGSTCTWDLISE